MPTTSATTANTVSNGPTVRGARAAAAGAGREAAAAGALAGAAGRATEVPGAFAGAAGAAGAAATGAAAAGRGICWVAAIGAAAGRGAAGAPPVGGSEGSLIVGAAVGFGGKAIRTVSFFGWTLAASGGFGGTGEFGVGSAIKLFTGKYEAAKMVSNCYSPNSRHSRVGFGWSGSLPFRLDASGGLERFQSDGPNGIQTFT